MAENTRRSAERGEGPITSQDRVGSPDGRQSSYWRVWAPLLARAFAIGLALLGLAGIGLAAARSESSPYLRAPFAVGLAQLLGGSPLLSASVVADAAAGGLSQPGAPLLDRGQALAPAQGAAAPTAAAPTAAAPAAPTPSAAAPTAPGPTAPGPTAAALAPVVPIPPPPTPAPCAPAPSTREQSAPGASGGMPVATSAGLTADGRVILNRAGLAELQRLPGVGAKRAAAILELRQRLGRLRRPSDLLRIKGIGPRLLERMLPRLVLDG